MFYLIAITVPFPILMHLFVPESYRFLCSRGQFEKARKVIEKFPKTKEANQEEIYTRRVELLESVNNGKSINGVNQRSPAKPSALKGLFGNKYMVLSLVLLIIIWYEIFFIFHFLIHLTLFNLQKVTNRELDDSYGIFGS